MGVRTASRRPTRSGDDDDWFAEASSSAPRGRAPEDAEPGDDWLSERRRPRTARRDLPLLFRSRRALLIAAGLVVLLVIGLIVGGVFSGGKSVPQPTIPPTTVAPPTTTHTVPTVAIPSTTLKPGDTGAQVKILQRALAALGYSSGKVDGSYGPATQAALERFQRAHKLTPDGIFGPATRHALALAVAKL